MILIGVKLVYNIKINVYNNIGSINRFDRLVSKIERQ